MTRMNRAFISGENMNGQLDRLVSGELDEQDRGPVIAWLEEDPRRWRLCGLLFLESQTWSQATCGVAVRKPNEGNAGDVHPGRSRRQASEPTATDFCMSQSSRPACCCRSCLVLAARDLRQREQLPDAGDQIATDRLGNPSHSGITPVLAELPVESSSARFAAIHHSITRRAKVGNLAEYRGRYGSGLRSPTVGAAGIPGPPRTPLRVRAVARRPAGRRSH